MKLLTLFLTSVAILAATPSFAQEAPKTCSPAIQVLSNIDKEEPLLDGGVANPAQTAALVKLAKQDGKNYDFVVVLAHGNGVFGWVFGYKVDETGDHAVLCTGGHVPTALIQQFIDVINSNAKFDSSDGRI